MRPDAQLCRAVLKCCTKTTRKIIGRQIANLNCYKCYGVWNAGINAAACYCRGGTIVFPALRYQVRQIVPLQI
ncbi:MAG: hypothetical protein ACK56F_20580 [bacterium]